MKEGREYYRRISSERTDKLFVRIMNAVTENKRYRGGDCTASSIAAELGIKARDISAVVAIQTGENYNTLVNNLRLRDACKMLSSSSYNNYSVEEIGLYAGFSSRQSFYLAFSMAYDITPRQYRLLHNKKR